MALPIRYPIEPALPPHVLVPWAGSTRVFVLEAAHRGGWGAPPNAVGPCRSVLALDPEVHFTGGLASLRQANTWLEHTPIVETGSRILMGCLGYELGNELEPLHPWGPAAPPRRSEALRPSRGTPSPASASSGLPSVELAGFRAAYYFEPDRARGWVSGDDARAVAQLRMRVEGWARSALSAPASAPSLPVSALDARAEAQSAQQYRQGVERILDWIRAGDAYQVNLSRRIELASVPPGAARWLHGQLVHRHPAPYQALLELPRCEIVSNSPERFLRVLGSTIETRPIKGTRPRGRNAAEDEWLAKDLLQCAKDRAEHLMIVDLERNDLGRICQTGTIHVPRFSQVESFSTVHHLVSWITGRLRRGTSLEDILAATFPGGSITGAPKLRARQIIAELESVPRGVYTGAIGLLDAGGGVDLSIAIRTAVMRGTRASIHVGAGIVADSDPETELRETRDKARAFHDLWTSPEG